MPRGNDLKPRKPRSDKLSPSDVVPCRDCGTEQYRWFLSKAGLCPGCGVRRMRTCVQQLQSKEGEYYERWKAARALSKVNLEGGSNG